MGDTPAKLPDTYNVHSQDKRPGISFPVDKIDGRPNDLKAHLKNVSNSTQEQLKGDKKIQEVFRKLEERFGESFDRKNFDIKSCILKPNEIQLLGFEVYTLWNKQNGRLLAYINQDGETLFEMKDFKPFINDFYKALDNKVGLDYKQDEKGKWIMIWKGQEYPEGTEYFDRGVIATNILKLD